MSLSWANCLVVLIKNGIAQIKHALCAMRDDLDGVKIVVVRENRLHLLNATLLGIEQERFAVRRQGGHQTLIIRNT